MTGRPSPCLLPGCAACAVDGFGYCESHRQLLEPAPARDDDQARPEAADLVTTDDETPLTPPRAAVLRVMQQLLTLGVTLDQGMQAHSDACRPNGTRNGNWFLRCAEWLNEASTSSRVTDREWW